jgi:hypothetical protein
VIELINADHLVYIDRASEVFAAMNEFLEHVGE